MKLSDIAIILSIALLFMGIAYLQSVSASPYILNLTSGQLIDLNTSNSTENITIYVIYQNASVINTTNVYNITCQNVTNVNNITNVNMTCVNCTNYYNQTINNSYYDYGYNKTDLDGNFVKLSDYNSWKSGLTYATKDELTNQINNSVSSIKESSTGNLWIVVIILGVVQVLFILFIIIKIRSSE